MPPSISKSENLKTSIVPQPSLLISLKKPCVSMFIVVILVQVGGRYMGGIGDGKEGNYVIIL